MFGRMTLRPVNAPQLRAERAAFGELLVDAVEHGASIGFTLPFAPGEVESYWEQVAAAVAGGHKLLWGAWDDAGRLVGTAQLALEPRSNGRHRAEVQKVIVRHAARGRGIGAALMQAVEAAARAHGRWLLFLDTSVGEAGACAFYTKLGYAHVGGIPDYAANPDGTLVANAIFCKRLA